MLRLPARGSTLSRFFSPFAGTVCAARRLFICSAHPGDVSADVALVDNEARGISLGTLGSDLRLGAVSSGSVMFVGLANSGRRLIEFGAINDLVG